MYGVYPGFGVSSSLCRAAQLGLKPDTERGPVDVLVIERLQPQKTRSDQEPVFAGVRAARGGAVRARVSVSQNDPCPSGVS
jgi:hypothetical protein